MNVGVWSLSQLSGFLTFTLLGVGATNLFLLVLLLRRKATGADTRCGACSYSAEGLERDRCPECGASVIRVGILTGKLRPGLETWQMMLVLIFAFAAIIGPIFAWGYGRYESAYPARIGMSDREFRFGPDDNGLQLYMIHQAPNRRDLPAWLYPELGDYPAYAFFAPRSSARPEQLLVEGVITADTQFTPDQLGPTFVQPDGPVSEKAVEEWLRRQAFPSMDMESPEGVAYLEAVRGLVVRNLDGLMTEGAARAESPFSGASSSSSSSGEHVHRVTWLEFVYWLGFAIFSAAILFFIVRWAVRRRARIRSLRI